MDSGVRWAASHHILLQVGQPVGVHEQSIDATLRFDAETNQTYRDHRADDEEGKEARANHEHRLLELKALEQLRSREDRLAVV